MEGKDMEKKKIGLVPKLILANYCGYHCRTLHSFRIYKSFLKLLVLSLEVFYRSLFH